MPRPTLFNRPAGLVLWLCIVLPLGGCGSPSEPSTEPPSELHAERPEPPSESPAERPEPPAELPAERPEPPAELDGDAAASADTGRAEDFVGVEAKAPSEYLREPRFAEADFVRGEVLSYACRACHAFDPGEESPLGPHLAGVFGRRAGTLKGFEYSQSLRDSGIVWTPAALEAWLAQPEDFIPGNNMAFTGFRSAGDRRDLVAYLLRELGDEDDAAVRDDRP